jgi:UDP-N-acetylmuramate dehydrogenase
MTPDPGRRPDREGRWTRELEDLAHALERLLPGQVTRDQPVAELTTYRLGGPAAIVVRVADLDELGMVAAALGEDAPPVLVVGRGSNLLVADVGFDGLAVVLTGTFEELTVDADAAMVDAGGAVPLPVVARQAAAVGVGGLEFLVGIPGSVGGAVRMNAGGHGASTAEVLDRAWVVGLRGDGRGVPEELRASQLALGYRHSNLEASDVVTRAVLQGTVDTADACAARLDEVVRWRREHQPGGANAGSVFRNPPNDAAGRLIDAAGCKGLRVGGAFVSPKHANFFQADRGATAGDVHRLVDEIRRRVADQTGVWLEPELHMVGFEPAAGAVSTPEGRS